ncbi:CPBP family intramembrane glutamic endopeptidase [Natrinema halophilum]|uniref:CPBP family intramembrane metalloprotease n=1 Tax=Natrinema halophilum TaxID=1699371 RepID=A0A7D5KSR5_9EURY|nr:CPBP family intramembrane glutamic endopeptidase [Natrinema halophilum]QLG50617.1 CPBP family intramembrane metalloprotease [Natrinema halophilum]
MDSHATPDRGTSESRIHTRKVGLFLALAFGIAWTGAIVLSLVGIELRTFAGLVLVVVVVMWAPAFAAIGTQLRYGESIRKGCGLALGRLRWVGLAWVTPVALVAATIGVGTAFPGVSFTTDYTAYLLELGLPQEQAAETVAQLETVPVPPAVLFVVQGLVAGLTINALAALGEELGWRGLLLTELAPLGFWKFSLFTGAVWGIWHAPIILQGHNFPDAPLAGVFVMTAATIAMTPIYTYLTLRARSVLAATVLHGSFNGLGALSLVYLTGAGNLATAPVGVAGIGAAVFITALCVVHDRIIADERIMTGRPLSPWV